MAYKIALFLHVCGALGLFAAVGIEVVGTLGFRRAQTVDQVRTYARVVKVSEPMFPVVSVLLLAAGIYMTIMEWSFRTPFVVVGLITLIAMAVLGSTVQGKHWQAVEKAAHDLPDGPVPPSLRRLIDGPRAWASMGGSVAVALGVVALMTIKPGWVASIATVAIAYAVGGVAGWMFVARPSEVPAPGVTA